MIVTTKHDYSRLILESQKNGMVDKAIEYALNAREKYPNENIFEKFLGDLYVEKNDFKNASDYYIEFFKKIGDNRHFFKDFANFFQLYVETQENIEDFVCQIEECLDKGFIFNAYITVNICKLIAPYIKLERISLFENDKNFESVRKYIQSIKKRYKKYVVFYKILLLPHSAQNMKIDKYIVSLMEKEHLYPEALELIVKVLRYDQDQVAVRTLFRICRKIGDYTDAENYLETHADVKNAEQFNILYELVFYYSKTGDIENRNQALKKIENCGKNSIPIMRTLYNFYLQFGMLNEASKINKTLNQMEIKNVGEVNADRKEQEKDSTEALLAAIKELFSELEHSRKLISMSELLKGFSHELGQPITNIRYGVQLYQMKMDMGLDTREELESLLNDILGQTHRIKNMLARFSPVTSERNGSVNFSVGEEIKAIFNEFATRLSKENIEWKLDVDTDFYLYGDNIKFDQIFYNLIGNSIYAIKEKGENGFILVSVYKKADKAIITFEDNGTGIKPEYRGKIFEPFFTTKDYVSDENGGGEGLGLYIIWNIVRMFNGDIILDKEFQDGARFIITINIKEENVREK